MRRHRALRVTAAVWAESQSLDSLEERSRGRAARTAYGSVEVSGRCLGRGSVPESRPGQLLEDAARRGRVNWEGRETPRRRGPFQKEARTLALTSRRRPAPRHRAGGNERLRRAGDKEAVYVSGAG